MLKPGLTDQSIASGGVDEVVGQIQEQANAELVLSSVGGTLIADGNEQTLLIVNEPLGCWEPTCLIIDLDNMGTGNTIEVRVYHRLSDAGTLKLWHYSTYTGADGGLTNGCKVIAIDLKPNRHGFQATLQQTDQDYVNFPWEIFARL